MATYAKIYDLSDGVAFARALKVSTDIGDTLVGVAVNQTAATASCTFNQGDRQPPSPPSGSPLTYDVSNGVAFARVLKVHTDIGNKLIWVVVHIAASTADCWFE